MPDARRSFPAVLPDLVWEAVLLFLALVVTGLGVAAGHFTPAHLAPRFALLGLVAAGLALSLRTGTPNLALTGQVAVGQLLYVVLVQHNLPGLVAGVLTVLIVLVMGVVLAVIAGLTGQPGWAVTLAGLAACYAITLGAGTNMRVLPLAHLLTPGYFEVFSVLFVLGSLGGGALWLVPQVRLFLSPEPESGVGRRLVRALVGIGGSSALAGIAGALTAGYIGGSQVGLDLVTLLVALGAVLLGGISLAGRGGGVAGTVLGVYILAAFEFMALIHAWSLWAGTLLPATLAMLVGLPVAALLDHFRARRDATTSGTATGGPAAVPAAFPPPTAFPPPAFPPAPGPVTPAR